MKSANIGDDISPVEVLNVSPRGFWILIRGEELFLDFDLFPWFRNATVSQLFAVELLGDDHLFWSSLDIDLDTDRIKNPQNYPLVSSQV
jgi:hypothetical protein